MQDKIGLWADAQFPDRTVFTTLTKLFEEIGEFVKSGLKEPDEFADIVILVLDIAHQRGIDVEAATEAKMQVNMNRKWERSHLGQYQHKDE
jgi:NTP pyrophosphatase (non-canonical NTP hydrolase)